MPGRNEAWPGRVVEITFHEEESKLRLSDCSLGTDPAAHSPILLAVGEMWGKQLNVTSNVEY